MHCNSKHTETPFAERIEVFDNEFIPHTIIKKVPSEKKDKGSFHGYVDLFSL